MKVSVEILTSSELLLPDGEKRATIELPDGSTVQDVMRALGATDDTPWNASIDGQLVYADTTVGAGAKVLVFAPIQGGESPLRNRE
jgi:sulfur carrier protein ThiS